MVAQLGWYFEPEFPVETAPAPAAGPVAASEARVWFLHTPSHDRLVLAEKRSPGEYVAEFMPPAAGNYSVTDVTEAVREFITLNPEWVRDAQGGQS